MPKAEKQVKNIYGSVNFKSNAKLGKETHTIWQDGVKERVIPGTRLRPDMYDDIGFVVKELKPDNIRALRRGEKQLNGYLDAAGPQFRGELWAYHYKVGNSNPFFRCAKGCD